MVQTPLVAAPCQVGVFKAVAVRLASAARRLLHSTFRAWLDATTERRLKANRAADFLRWAGEAHAHMPCQQQCGDSQRLTCSR